MPKRNNNDYGFLGTQFLLSPNNPYRANNAFTPDQLNALVERGQIPYQTYQSLMALQGPTLQQRVAGEAGMFLDPRGTVREVVPMQLHPTTAAAIQGAGIGSGDPNMDYYMANVYERQGYNPARRYQDLQAINREDIPIDNR